MAMTVGAARILADLPLALMLALPNRRLVFANARAGALFADGLASQTAQTLLTLGQLKADRIEDLLRRAACGQQANHGLWFAPGLRTGWLEAQPASPRLLRHEGWPAQCLLLTVHLDEPALTQAARIDALSRQCRLTAAERHVLLMLADGAAVAIAARQLGLQTSTVRSHVRKLLGKSGAPSLMQLLRWLGSDALKR